MYTLCRTRRLDLHCLVQLACLFIFYYANPEIGLDMAEFRLLKSRVYTVYFYMNYVMYVCQIGQYFNFGDFEICEVDCNPHYQVLSILKIQQHSTQYGIIWKIIVSSYSAYPARYAKMPWLEPWFAIAITHPCFS
jgi:hypothetical protein